MNAHLIHVLTATKELANGLADAFKRFFEGQTLIQHLNLAFEIGDHQIVGHIVKDRAVTGIEHQGPAPDLLVNLAKAYLVARNKRAAVHALRRALNRSRGVDPRAQAELAALGIRRTPVLGFLPRGFFLNAWLGRLRSWVLTRVGSDADGNVPVPAELGTVSGDVEQARRALADGTPGEGP